MTYADKRTAIADRNAGYAGLNRGRLINFARHFAKLTGSTFCSIFGIMAIPAP
jgi:hypothetical protein